MCIYTNIYIYRLQYIMCSPGTTSAFRVGWMFEPREAKKTSDWNLIQL